MLPRPKRSTPGGVGHIGIIGSGRARVFAVLQRALGAIGARGVNYWESKDRKDRRLLYLNAGNLTAINAQTGETITSFGKNGRVDLRVALWRDARNPLQTSNPGRIFENLFIISLPAQGAGYDATPADVQAYDVVTGKIAWAHLKEIHDYYTRLDKLEREAES